MIIIRKIVKELDGAFYVILLLMFLAVFCKIFDTPVEGISSEENSWFIKNFWWLI